MLVSLHLSKTGKGKDSPQLCLGAVFFKISSIILC